MLDDLQSRIDPAALLALAVRVRDLGYSFVTPTPATLARVNTRPNAAWARDLRGALGWSRPFRADLLPPAVFGAMRAAGVLLPNGPDWRSTVRLSTLGPDLFLHSAYPTTDQDSVFFGPDTYRFCDAIRATLADMGPIGRAVDVCAGAGPGAVTIARLRPEADIVIADINPRAVAYSRVNATLAGLPSIEAHQGDLLRDLAGNFDLIVANPPYIADRAGRTYRDGGGSHGLGLSTAILDGALTRLRPGGRLLLYTGVAILDGVDPFRAVAAERLRDWDGTWTYREVDPDVFGEELDEPAYADADRIAAVVLVATHT